MRKMRVAILSPLAVALVLTTAWGGGEKDRGGRDQAGNRGHGVMDPKAIEVLKEMSDYLGQAKGYSFEGLAIIDEVGQSGIITKHFHEGKVTLIHPDKFLVIAHRDDGKIRRFSFDGTAMAYVLVGENSFVRIPFTGTTDGVLDYMDDNYPGLLIPVGDFLYNNIAGTFLEDVISAKYLGLKTIEGIPCHHLSFESTGGDWELWVQAGSQPLPLMYAINFVTMKDSPQLLVTFKNWNLNPYVDEKAFSFTPPAGAKQIELQKGARIAP